MRSTALVFTGFVFLMAALRAFADSPAVNEARVLYQRTDYEKSLHVLDKDPAPDADGYLLRGQDYFMLGDYKRAIELFEKALSLSPNNSDIELWLGRAWGRRAEKSGWWAAPMLASKARQHFESAVALDPRNAEASNDLFDFYLNAPGILGGGIDKAEAIARRIAAERPPESEHEQAQIAEHRKDYAAAEAHLRRAMELAPAQAGRIVDLACLLAKRGRFVESDQLFKRAEKLAPSLARIAFAEARTDIENHRNLTRARELLDQYLHAGLTPDDPPLEDAAKLLRRAAVE